MKGGKVTSSIYLAGKKKFKLTFVNKKNLILFYQTKYFMKYIMNFMLFCFILIQLIIIYIF